MMTKALVCLLIPLAVTAAPSVRSEMLVSTSWLAEHLADSNLVILHISRERAVYDEGHIPGARFLAFTNFAVTRDGAQNELPPVADLKKLFEDLGVSDNSRVILYGDNQVLHATRAYFTLDYLGHGDHVALLDGGLAKWRVESRALTKEAPPARRGNLTVRPRPEIVVSTEVVKDLSQTVAGNSSGTTVLLDVRSADQARQRGQIPGSVRRFWKESEAGADTSALRSEPELRKLYESLGVTPDRAVVTYCGSGVQATQTYFTLKYLGYDNVRMYDGSFTEWAKANSPEGETAE